MSGTGSVASDASVFVSRCSWPRACWSGSGRRVHCPHWTSSARVGGRRTGSGCRRTRCALCQGPIRSPACSGSPARDGNRAAAAHHSGSDLDDDRQADRSAAKWHVPRAARQSRASQARSGWDRSVGFWGPTERLGGVPMWSGIEKPDGLVGP